MRPWVLGFWCALVLCGSSSGLAQQQQTGPRTLEGLLKSDEAQKPVVAAAEAAATDAGPRRPAGTVARPKNGVQHPDLDAAWADYDKQIEAVANAVEDAIETELNSAAATGDLDASLKWKTAGEQFQKDGRIPDGLDGRKSEGRSKPKRAKPESSPQSRIKEAQERLAKAYETAEKALVKSHDFEKAGQVRAEKVLLIRLGGEVAYLSDMKPHGLSVPAEGTPFQQGTVSVGGAEKEHGIFLHPPSRGSSTATFKVPQDFAYLSGSVAMSDSAIGQKTPLTFKILDDTNALLWRSAPVLGRARSQAFHLELGRTSTVTLVVECPGDHAFAHAVWVEPRFTQAISAEGDGGRQGARAACVGLWRHPNGNIEAIRKDGVYVVNGDVRNPWSGKWHLDERDPRGACVVREANNKTVTRFYLDPADPDVLRSGPDSMKRER